MFTNTWEKAFKNGPSKIWGREPKADHVPLDFLKAVLHKLYSVHSVPYTDIRDFILVIVYETIPFPPGHRMQIERLWSAENLMSV